jgi:hypothetical protein
MPGEILKRVEDSKIGRFVASIPTNGQGLLHLVEDVETGFVMAFPALKGWEIASQDVIDGVQKAEADKNAATQTPVPVTPVPAPVAAPVPVVAGPGLAGTGLDAPAPAYVAPAAGPDLPPLG